MLDTNQNADNLGNNQDSSEEQQRKEEILQQARDSGISEDDIEEANKPQPNVILNNVGATSRATSYHDTERVSPRANEASDQKDTNTGGIIAGGAKGTSQS